LNSKNEWGRWLRDNGLLTLILLVGLVLRLVGLGFGNPFRYHPDEIKLVIFAGNLLDYQKWNAETLFLIKGYPPFYPFVLTASFLIYVASLLLSGTAAGFAAVKDYYYLHPFHFHMVGRLLSVLCSMLTILVVQRTGERLYSRRTGLWVAAFLSFGFLMVKHAHFGIVDSLLTLLTSASFYFSVAIFKRGDRRDYLLAGTLAGLAIATKYNAGLILICIVAAHLLSRPFALRAKLLDRRIWLAGLATIAAFLIACPLPLLDFGRFWQSVRGTAEFEQSGKLGSGGTFFSYFTGAHFPGYGFFTDNTFPSSLGWGLVVLFVAGILYLCWRHRREDILLLLFPLLTYVVIGQMAYKAMRHLLPMAPFLLLIAAELVEVVRARIRVHRNILIYYGIIFIIVLAPTMVKSWRWDLALLQPDTRTTLKDWIEASIPAGSRIGTEEFTPPLLSIRDLNYDIIRRSRNYRAAYEIYGLVPKMFVHGNLCTTEHDASAYVVEHGIRYVVLDSFTESRYQWPQSQVRYREVVRARQRFYQWVCDHGRLIQQRTEGVDEQISPRLWIYEINADAAP